MFDLFVPIGLDQVTQVDHHPCHVGLHHLHDQVGESEPLLDTCRYLLELETCCVSAEYKENVGDVNGIFDLLWF